MRVLVHVCCGPCSLTVFEWLFEHGYTPTAFFFNPNIHPLAEYMKRREGAAQAAQHFGIELIQADCLPKEQQRWFEAPASEWAGELGELPWAMDPVPWLRRMHGQENERCELCWKIRMEKTAEIAVLMGFEAVTSSLLYSRYQSHASIRELVDSTAERYGLTSVYQDFRSGWQRGIDISKKLGIYRQQYCGCIFSEYSRYTKKFTMMRKNDP